MITGTDLGHFKKNASYLVKQTIKHNGRVRISTDEGNAVVLSEQDYMRLVDMQTRPIITTDTTSLIDW